MLRAGLHIQSHDRVMYWDSTIPLKSIPCRLDRSLLMRKWSRFAVTSLLFHPNLPSNEILNIILHVLNFSVNGHFDSKLVVSGGQSILYSICACSSLDFSSGEFKLSDTSLTGWPPPLIRRGRDRIIYDVIEHPQIWWWVTPLFRGRLARREGHWVWISWYFPLDISNILHSEQQ